MLRSHQRAKKLRRLHYKRYRASSQQAEDFNVFLYTYLKHTRLYPTQGNIQAIAVDALEANGVPISHASVDPEMRNLERLINAYRDTYLKAEVDAYRQAQGSSADIAAWQGAASAIVSSAAHAGAEDEEEGVEDMMSIFSGNTERIRWLREHLYHHLKYYNLQPDDSQRDAMASQGKLQARHGTSLATVRDLVNREVCGMHRRELRREVSAYASAGPLHQQEAAENVDPTAGLIGAVPPSSAASSSGAGPSHLASHDAAHHMKQDITTEGILAALASMPPAVPVAPAVPPATREDASNDVSGFFNSEIPMGVESG